MATPMFSWGLIVLIGVVGLVIAALALAINESTRTAGLALGLLLLIAVGAFAALGLYFVRVSPSTPLPPSKALPVTPIPPAERSIAPAKELIPAEAPAVDPVPIAPDPKPLPSPSPTEPSTSTDATSKIPAPISAEAQLATKPSWIDQPPHLQGTIYRVAVKSGLFVTKGECEKAIEPKLQAAVTEYMDEYLGLGASRNLSVDAEFLSRIHRADYDETVRSASVGPMQQTHVLLEFDDTARRELNTRWHAIIVTHRLGRVGIVSGVVLSLLAVAFGYLRIDLSTAGRSRGQLRLAAVAAILLVATTAAIARRVLEL